jgi:flagellar assembly factor FliW
MAKNSKKTYWPHMIMGFLMIGITLGYWTVKSAISIPVQESNSYMLKYQQADIHINDIIKSKLRFDKAYKIALTDVTLKKQEIENAKRAKAESVVVLKKGTNSFSYIVSTLGNQVVNDANVTFLLTRPHSVKEDLVIANVPFVNGKYTVNSIDIQKAGRYILRLRVQKGDAIGYNEEPAYLQPE